MKYVCVFCGANPGNSPRFSELARQLGSEIGSRGLGLVYGGAQVGLMGTVADAVLASSGPVIGVIPQALMKRELAHPGLTELKVVSTMHERKALMADLADGFIALPGGFGTMDETFEIVTWSQLGFHKKPCGLLDDACYYDHLKRFIDDMVAAGFVKQSHADLLMFDASAAVLLDRMQDFTWQAVPKWTEKDIR